MDHCKHYEFTVDDVVLYHKKYRVRASSKKEAIEKFKGCDWYDSEGEETTMSKSIIKKVRRFL